MKIDIKHITEGEESVVIRYKELTSKIDKVIRILREDGNKLLGKTDEENVLIDKDDILYLESVDDKVFAYTKEKVLKIEGSLNTFMLEVNDESFFRCSKTVIINVNRVISLKSMSSNRIDTTMEGGEHIIISRRYASEFRRLLKGEN